MSKGSVSQVRYSSELYERFITLTIFPPVWYSNLGWSNIFGSLIMYGIGQIRSGALFHYQVIFLLLGCVTVLVGLVRHDKHPSRVSLGFNAYNVATAFLFSQIILRIVGSFQMKTR